MNRSFRCNDQTLEAAPGETLLQALDRQHWRLPHACRNGNCYLCDCQLERGSALQQGQQLSAPAIVQACIAQPGADQPALRTPSLHHQLHLPLQQQAVQLLAIEPLAPLLLRLQLRLPALRTLTTLQSGQWLNWGRRALPLLHQEGRDLQVLAWTRWRPDLEQARGLLRLRYPYGQPLPNGGDYTLIGRGSDALLAQALLLQNPALRSISWWKPQANPLWSDWQQQGITCFDSEQQPPPAARWPLFTR